MGKENSVSLPADRSFVLKITVFALALTYLINCLSPLRLHVDTLRYFAVRDCMDGGCPPDSVAAKDYLPYGYTALLLILSKIGLLKSFTIILVNCIYLGGALWLVKKMFGSALRTWFYLLLVLLNWTIIKFVTHPLSEMQYLFFSVACLYFFVQYTRNKRLLSLLFSFLFAILAFLTKSIGVTLAGALVAGLAWQFRKELLLLIRKNRVVVAIMVLVMIGVVVFSKQLGLDHYKGVFTKQFDEGATFTNILGWHFTEWTEISFNTSIVKLFPYLPASTAKLIFIVAGIALFAGFIYLLFIRKNSIPFIVKAYLFFYSLLIFTWPFYDPRFWVPLIPLIIAVVCQYSFYQAKWKKILVYLFSAVYVVVGVLSVGYITYTSLNKEKFSRTQANGVYRNEYETFFYGKPLSDTATKTDPVILDVLKRYDR